MTAPQIANAVLNILSGLFGIVAAALWFKASKIDVAIKSNVKPGDAGTLTQGEADAFGFELHMRWAFLVSSKISAKAALFTAVSIALSTAATLLNITLSLIQ